MVGSAISFTWNIGQGLATSVPQLLAASFAASIITDICDENAREHGASGSVITSQDITDHIASKLNPKETKIEVKEEAANKPKEGAENSNSNLPVPFDGEFTTKQLLGTTKTLAGRDINFHAADRIANPPKSRAQTVYVASSICTHSSGIIL